jgi:hypothetical protein
MSRTYGAYTATLLGDYLDIRGQHVMRSDVYASERYDASQKLGEEVRSSGGAGLIYNKRPVRYYPANQSDTPGFVRTL